MKNVMSRAWEIAREAVKTFGGSVKSYIAEALRMAWAEVKEVKVADWFENKVLREENGSAFEIFCKIRETEKAIYAMCFIGFNSTGSLARKKTLWIPKSVIENAEAIKEIADYESASYAFSFEYAA